MASSQDSSTVQDFASQASAFCDLVARAETLPPDQFLRDAHLHLPVLYATALRLRNVWTLAGIQADEVDSTVADAAHKNDSVPDELPGHDKWMARWRALGAHLGTVNLYRSMFSPFDLAEVEPVTSNLADDLLDIQRDLQRGLDRWQGGDAVGAEWEWQFHFAAHWGRHAAGALRALHDLAYDDIAGQPYVRSDP